ncbi:MAG TPA: hypothetical protein VFO62_10520 [Candidatus Binatia bacterium]|nr:hypothetical protein [Candidatus Binatia bacterium]
MSNTVGILPGAATMASYPMIAACRACYAAAGYLLRSNAVGGAVRRAWRRGDAWEVAFWCAWLQVEIRRVPARAKDLERTLDRTLTDLCCAEGINPLDVWQALPAPDAAEAMPLAA